jgi:hypothetical protein
LLAGSDITGSYRLQVTVDSGFQSFAVNDSVSLPQTQFELSRTVGPLSPGVRYYWRVLGVGPGGSTASEVRSFTVTASP